MMHNPSQSPPSLPGVKHIIALASGKGGVGKSTTSVNLAAALLACGARVGLLDADIYGPSQPHLLGICEHPKSMDGKHLEPIERYGLQTMSMGYLIERDVPMVWRGPMLIKAVNQLLHDTRWHDLDILVIDLPPGTGDVPLSLAQKLRIDGIVIVTTPQDVALLDVRKAVNMCRKVNFPILGLVENMSYHQCNQCGHQEYIFGEAGGVAYAEQENLPFLGAIPLHTVIRQHADQGNPIVIADPLSEFSVAYHHIARTLITTLSLPLQQQETA